MWRLKLPPCKVSGIRHLLLSRQPTLGRLAIYTYTSFVPCIRVLLVTSCAFRRISGPDLWRAKNCLLVQSQFCKLWFTQNLAHPCKAQPIRSVSCFQHLPLGNGRATILILQGLALRSRGWSLGPSNWRMVLLWQKLACRTILPCMSCWGFLEVPRKGRRRLIPSPRNRSISTRRSSWLCWTFTRYLLPA